MIKEIHDQDFAKETDTGIAVIDFRADWCPPCRMMDPILKSFSEDPAYKDQVNFVSLNIDHDQATASQFQVQGIPTFLIKKDGQVVSHMVGARPKPDFEAELKKALA
ncbi:thioredoxin family protein [Lactiplantibacillus plantarum]|uniref:thioredoxin family protein n=1 Tax=Lactiplantibacillus plantarum TaxID=1590 RepID=UPI00136E3FCC|nr:thioredoxin family protein [Lactiplantibacillus plantarum]MYU98392.1 thioredoxin fold domain-containing protein [Lactiplantibacillus plantarum]QJY41458.1 thioredoxin family protein [Lactiplantibacillus plantarum]QYN63849.1 thioredoxin family protein [Lactiplantibacillus plantarum]